MNKIKNVAEKALSLLCIVIALLAIFILIVVFTSKDKGIPLLGGRTAMLVVSPSMEPEYKAYTCVFVKEVDTDSLNIGDDITFYSQDPSIYMKVVTHRITDIEDTSKGLYFTTKGINNAAEDGYEVPADKIIGKVTGQSEVLGSIVTALSRTEVFIALICIPIVLMVVVNVIAFRKKAKELAYKEMMEGSADYRFFTLDEIDSDSQFKIFNKLVSGRSENLQDKLNWEMFLARGHVENEISFRAIDGDEDIFLSYACCDIYDNLKTFHIFLMAANPEYITPGLFKQSYNISVQLAQKLKCHRVMVTVKPEWTKLYSGCKLVQNTSYSDESKITLEQRI